jgi:hypothetical protein
MGVYSLNKPHVRGKTSLRGQQIIHQEKKTMPESVFAARDMALRFADDFYKTFEACIGLCPAWGVFPQADLERFICNEYSHSTVKSLLMQLFPVPKRWNRISPCLT